MSPEEMTQKNSSSLRELTGAEMMLISGSGAGEGLVDNAKRSIGGAIDGWKKGNDIVPSLGVPSAFIGALFGNPKPAY